MKSIDFGYFNDFNNSLMARMAIPKVRLEGLSRIMRTINKNMPDEDDTVDQTNSK